MTNKTAELPEEASGTETELEELPKMTLLEHLEELRKRISVSLAAVVVAAIACWFYADRIFSFLARPVTRYLPEGTKLVFTSLPDPFVLYVKVAFLAGLFIASPVILLELWLFLKPALYKHERKIAGPFIVFTSLFFLAGGYFGYSVAFPMVVRFLLSVGSQFQPMLTVQAYFSMMWKVLVGLGLVFELPILIFFLARLGLVTAKGMLRHLRWAVIAVFAVAAIITPTPDMATQTVFALPMLALYLLGVLVAAVFGKPREESGS